MSLVERLLEGDPRAIARALSLVENESPDAPALLAEIQPRAGRAIVIGLTGAPGAGKSTLADRLVHAFRQRGQRVAVLAVDPSSPFTGGAVLGDRVRMQGHANDPGVFIRSMATRGQLGGLAGATADAATVLDAAGFEIVLIETVGVGQAEIDVVRIADISIVIVAPGAGDEIQTLKAGLMEIADIFVVNKTDRDGADRAAANIEGMLALRSWEDAAWKPPVLMTVATAGQGVPALVEAIGRFQAQAGATLDERRRVRAVSRRHDSSTARALGHVALDHVGVAVGDAARVAELFKTLFGFETDQPETVGAHQVRFVETGAALVELVEALSADSPVATFLAGRGAGLHHLCFRVPDIDAALAALKAQGVRLVDEVARPGAHGARVAFLHPVSTGGVLVELKQAAP